MAKWNLPGLIVGSQALSTINLTGHAIASDIFFDLTKTPIEATYSGNLDNIIAATELATDVFVEMSLTDISGASSSSNYQVKVRIMEVAPAFIENEPLWDITPGQVESLKLGDLVPGTKPLEESMITYTPTDIAGFFSYNNGLISFDDSNSDFA